jgi:membrane glycosyltransferase
MSLANHPSEKDEPSHAIPYQLKGWGGALRRFFFFTLSSITTVYAIWMMVDVLSTDGFTGVEAILVTLFGINFLWIALSFYASIAGLVIRALGLDAISLKRVKPQKPARPLTSRNVILFPIYNEDPARVFAGLSATYQSLSATGHLNSFDFFVLSDTRDPDKWVEEELTWMACLQKLNANGKIFYRHRPHNTEKKAGNILEFCEKWGACYDHMIIFDADSVMSGDVMVKMAFLMEENPKVGIIQSPPVPTGRKTLFARILQFISRVHGHTMSLGLTFWTLGAGNYWGHNAILRVNAFMECCGLPILSGNPPFGGAILSHDFIEAAFMRRAGWGVWLVPDLEGSWEELPSNTLDYAARDRRWCQGNLQHTRLLSAKGLKPLSRLHLFMGIMSYISSPLWFLLLVTSTLAAFEASQTIHSFFPNPGVIFPVWPVSRSSEMLALMSFTLGMLIVPKFISAFLIMCSNRESKLYGGRIGLLCSMMGELIFSALLAPAMMMFHTKFVVGTLFGSKVGWEAQERGDAGVLWSTAWKMHKVSIILGLLWASLALWISAMFFWWMFPVLLGLVFSAHLTVFASRLSWGQFAQKLNLFMTPEETYPPAELRGLARYEAEKFLDTPCENGLQRVISDPYTASLHQMLLPSIPIDRNDHLELLLLVKKMMYLGTESLTKAEKFKILSYPMQTWQNMSLDDSTTEIQVV